MMGFIIGNRSLRMVSPLLCSKVPWSSFGTTAAGPSHRLFHHSTSSFKVQPYLLADIGEGITECRLVEWFVKPGDRVTQFEAICEVQSDKASVEITSRYDGVIKDLKYEVDDMAIVGEPILIMDVEEDIPTAIPRQEDALTATTSQDNASKAASSHEAQAGHGHQVIALTPNESQMFKVMTDSLKIPHFCYTNSVDVTNLGQVRSKLNQELSSTGGKDHKNATKLTPLAFILKGISQALTEHPRLNAYLDTETNPNNPALVMQEAHNFGMAVDTPRGLLVPVVKNVQRRSVQSLATEIRRLMVLAREGQLVPADMQGATFTVSNIGSIGGGAVSPVIVPPMTAIVAIGRIDDVPGFATDENGNETVVKRQKVVLSWCADHRIHDGGAVGRCAEAVKVKLEKVGELKAMLH